jgi:hypothetical protein
LDDYFQLFSPLSKMIGDFEYLSVSKWDSWSFEAGWGYTAICAGLGIVFLALSLHAYRRRNLECAGDFIAIPWLAPIFLVLYTLCCGACCHGFFSLFVREESYVFFILGFIIGFFTGHMLLERTVRIFRKKTFLGFVIFILVFISSFLVVLFDLFGIVRWVPNVEQVKGVNISDGTYYYTSYNLDLLTDPQQIVDILQIHQYGIEHRNEGDDSQDGMRVYITYAMADGTYRQRVYNINYNTDTGRNVKKYLSSPELVLGKIYTGQWIPEEINVWDLCITDPAEVRSLTDAIIADCLAGDLGQNWYYTNGSDYTFWIEISAGSSDDVYLYQSIQASSFAKNVVSWLENSKHSDIWEYMLKDYTK